MALIVSARVQAKLAAKEPPVTRDEILDCFANRTGTHLLDTRAHHATDPPTQWFIAETNYGRRLKICFMQTPQDVIIKSAFEPDVQELRIYEKYSKKLQG